MNKNKLALFSECFTDSGYLAAVAIDQGSSLLDIMLSYRKQAREDGTDILNKEPDLGEFKTTLAKIFSPHASSMLFDYKYGDQCQQVSDPQMGVLRAYELDVYAGGSAERLTAMPLDMSVYRLKEKGAKAIKLYLYYDPEDESVTNSKKYALVERVGAECKAHDIPFLFEPLVYRGELDIQSKEFAIIKPDLVKAAMIEFSSPQYSVDLLKVEIPFNINFVEGASGSNNGNTLHTRDEAKSLLKRCAEATHLPFIYLSAGVTADQFAESLLLANEACIPYSGFLCGRAIWHDALKLYALFGAESLNEWAKHEGLDRYRKIKVAADGLTHTDHGKRLSL